MVSIPRYDDLATALREENIDIVAGVNDDDNTEIDKIVAMTAPYMTTSILLVYNKFVDPDRLDGKSIALLWDQAETAPEGAPVQLYDTIEECLEAVNSGEVDYTYGTSYTTPYYLNIDELSNILYLPTSTQSIDICFGLAQPVDPDLLVILNKALRSLNSAQLDSIIYDNSLIDQDEQINLFIKDHLGEFALACISLLVLIIGATYGSISGYFGGKVDAVMQRIVEVIYSVPEVLVILLLSAMLGEAIKAYSGPGSAFVATMGANLISMFMAFGMLYWVGMSRIIRGQVLQVKQQEYVTAARALGASSGRIIKRHLLPNCIGQIVATTCLQIPSAIFTESFMSFLGVGVLAPMTSLGSMCSDALGGINTYPYRLIIPAIIISVMILAFNLFGDGLRDALDPRLKK